MAAQQFANNAQTTLASICNPGDVSISIVSATGFPTAVPYTVLIDSEYMLVTSGASTTTWGVSRAQEGSSAGTHAATATVTQDFTVAGLQSLDQSYYPFWGVSGLTGAIQPSRYVGSTGTGTPGSGTFIAGDWGVIGTGGFFVCTVGGSPGTFVTVAPQVFSSSFNTHILSTAPGPATLTNLAVNLASATVANSTDNRGTVIATVGASPVTGGSVVCRVNFNTPYANTNYSVQVTITDAPGNTGVQMSVTNKLVGSFDIWNNSTTSMAATDVYNIDYLVLG